MRLLLVVILIATASAQSHIQVQDSQTTESLRGVSTVSPKGAWASGTHGTYLRTQDGGRHWTVHQVPDASSLDFRGVVAFSADEAFLMSSGPGELSRIYHTSDAGRHWAMQFKNSNPKGFFDSIAFWDAKHGIVLGDPVPDENGKLKFELLETEDGEHWHAMSSAGLPEAVEGEGAFAASNSCLALLPSKYPRHIWFATGGKVARVFHSSDGGAHWDVTGTPIMQGVESAGIFSIAFRNEKDGVVAGGDYKKPDGDGPNLAFTHDGGKTWEMATIHPQAFFSAVVYDRAELDRKVYVVAQEYVLNVQPPSAAQRIIPKQKLAGATNAASPLPRGGAIVVGSKGVIASIR